MHVLFSADTNSFHQDFSNRTSTKRCRLGEFGYLWTDYSNRNVFAASLYLIGLLGKHCVLDFTVYIQFTRRLLEHLYLTVNKTNDGPLLGYSKAAPKRKRRPLKRKRIPQRIWHVDLEFVIAIKMCPFDLFQAHKVNSTAQIVLPTTASLHSLQPYAASCYEIEFGS